LRIDTIEVFRARYSSNSFLKGEDATNVADRFEGACEVNHGPGDVIPEIGIEQWNGLSEFLLTFSEEVLIFACQARIKWTEYSWLLVGDPQVVIQRRRTEVGSRWREVSKARVNGTNDFDVSSRKVGERETNLRGSVRRQWKPDDINVAFVV
jgi:hypothetical protein